MTTELGFKVFPHTSLEDFKKILEELTIDGTYDYGGEECIEYFVTGEVICHEIEDEDVPEMLRICDEHGYWPWIEPLFAEEECPGEEECKKKLAELDYDYAELWHWILETVGVYEEEDSEEEE